MPAQPQGSSGSGTFGTQSPDGSVIQNNPDGGSQPPQEQPDSPEIERAEQGTIVHKLVMAWQDGITYITALGRGTFLQDSFGNVTRILSSRLNSKRGDQAELVITAESISFDSPPDDFQCIPVDNNLDLIKNPRYSWALLPLAGDNETGVPVGEITVTFTQIKSALIRMIQTYQDSPFFPSSDQVNGLVQNNILQQLAKDDSGNTFLSVAIPVYSPDFNPTLPNTPPQWDGIGANLPDGNYTYAIVSVPVNLNADGDPIAIAVAATKEIISKLWRQENTPYLISFQLVWTQYFFRPAFLNPGGYIESPVGIVPDFFMSPSQDGTDTIFDQMSIFNPQDYSSTGISGGPVSISWLRKSDEVEYQRTWFRYPHSWIGSPIGCFDVDLYNQGNRPQVASDFDQLIA